MGESAWWDIIWFVLHFLCIVPITVNGYSVNYTYMLLATFSVILSRRIVLPDISTICSIIGFIAIFIASVFRVDSVGNVDRSFLSFVLTLSVFCFVFHKWNISQFQCFKLAVVWAGFVYSLNSISGFFYFGGSQLHFEAKDMIGSQRYGFIYVFAFWVCILEPMVGLVSRWCKHVIALVIFVGIFLTFSRSAVVSVSTSYLFYTIYICVLNYRSKSYRKMGQFVLKTVMIGMAGSIVLSLVFPITIEFYLIRLVELFLDRELLLGNLENSETSEGTRLDIWWHGFNFVVQNPVVGSGYLGIWITGIGGSAHNQYVDTLFRVGFIGFIIYHYYLFIVMQTFCRVGQHGVLVGFVGVLAYGMFHETFKESQGGYLLSVLVAVALQRRRVFGGSVAKGTSAPLITPIRDTSKTSITKRNLNRPGWPDGRCSLSRRPFSVQLKW